jgi:hypothetical protein
LREQNLGSFGFKELHAPGFSSQGFYGPSWFSGFSKEFGVAALHKLFPPAPALFCVRRPSVYGKPLMLRDARQRRRSRFCLTGDFR